MKRISRRDVLKTAVAGGIACGVGPSLWGNRAGAWDANSEVRLAIIGLGSGTLACYGQKGQTIDFYEIDPIIKRLSVPPDGQQPIFHYLYDAEARGSDVRVILGDGRLSLKSAPEHYYHILVGFYSTGIIIAAIVSISIAQLLFDELTHQPFTSGSMSLPKPNG